MPTPEAQRRRTIIWITVLVIPSLAFTLLAWTVLDARTAARDSSEAARASSTATNSLAEILSRRAPTLEYLGCHDRASDRVDLAYNEVVNSLLDADAALDTGDDAVIAKAFERAITARIGYDEAVRRLEATTDPQAPPVPAGKTIDDGRYRCPALPIP